MTKINDVFSGLGTDAFPCVVDTDVDSGTSLKLGDTKCMDDAQSMKDIGSNPIVSFTTVETEGSCSSGDCTSNKLHSTNIPCNRPTKDSNTKDHSCNTANDLRRLEDQIERAECIAESMQDIRIFPMAGGPSQLDKSMFTNMFDGIFVSARSVQHLERSCFKKILKGSMKEHDIEGDQSPKGLIAIETAKFMVPLSKKQQAEFNRKEVEFAVSHGWTRIPPPVPRRCRDELDLEDDVIFFTN
jgi:hypothetical protein